MPLRDLLLIVTIFSALPVCFLKPWFGVLVWYWLAYMNPHQQTWGIAATMPFSQLTAIATLSGFLLTRDRKPFVWSRETIVLAGFLAWTTVTTVFAMNPDAWGKWNEWWKILLLTFVAVPLFQDRQRLRWLLIVSVGSLGYYGFKGGLFSILTGGQHMIWGPTGTFLEGNTELALALNMALPLFVALVREEQRRATRWLLWATFGLTTLAILFTYSRGGLLGLVAVFALFFLKSSMRTKAILIPVFALAIAAVLAFTPDAWMARMHTIQTYESDASANSRLVAWQVSYRLAADNPVFGGGFRVMQQASTYARYASDLGQRGGLESHSVYFSLLAEQGFIGLTIFAVLATFSVLTLRRVEKLGRRHPNLAWGANYAGMLQISLVGFLVSGAFLSAAYFDFTYQIIMIIAVLRRVVEHEATRLATTPANLEATAFTTPALAPPPQLPRLLVAKV